MNNNSSKVDEVSSAVSLPPSDWHQNSEEKQSQRHLAQVVCNSQAEGVFWLQAGMTGNFPVPCSNVCSASLHPSKIFSFLPEAKYCLAPSGKAFHLTASLPHQSPVFCFISQAGQDSSRVKPRVTRHLEMFAQWEKKFQTSHCEHRLP